MVTKKVYNCLKSISSSSERITNVRLRMRRLLLMGVPSCPGCDPVLLLLQNAVLNSIGKQYFLNYTSCHAMQSNSLLYALLLGF